jgi:hypothetical protein
VIDYRYLYSIVLDRCQAEDERGRSLDSKLTSLIAGVVAFIGLSSRFPPSVVNAEETLLYLIPLSVLLAAFMVDRVRLAPSAESLGTFFATYPVRTLRDAVDAMTRVYRLNAVTNDRKAARLDFSVVATVVATGIVLVTQSVLALR